MTSPSSPRFRLRPVSKDCLLVCLAFAATLINAVPRSAAGSAPAAAEAPDATALREGWRLLGGYLPADAVAAFSRAAGPEAVLGAVLADLGVRGGTGPDLARSRQVLERLADGGEAPAVAARYHLARLHERESRGGEDADAQDHFRRLIESAPASEHGEWTRVREALRLVYAAGDGDLPAAVASAERLSGELSRTESRRNLHLQLALAADRFALPPEVAHRHYALACDLGLARASTRAFVLLRLGDLAVRLDRLPEAAARYQAFVHEFPRDERTPTVRLRLAAVTTPP